MKSVIFVCLVLFLGVGCEQVTEPIEIRTTLAGTWCGIYDPHSLFLVLSQQRDTVYGRGSLVTQSQTLDLSVVGTLKIADVHLVFSGSRTWPLNFEGRFYDNILSGHIGPIGSSENTDITFYRIHR
jgi:hypothetical protein